LEYLYLVKASYLALIALERFLDYQEGVTLLLLGIQVGIYFKDSSVGTLYIDSMGMSFHGSGSQ